MKKFFIYIFIFVLFMSNKVFASGANGADDVELPSPTVSDFGYCTKGYFIGFSSNGDIVEMTITAKSNQGLYLVNNNGGYVLYTTNSRDCSFSKLDKPSNNTWSTDEFSSNNSLWSTNWGNHSTNIPVFNGSDTEGINKYIRDGDMSNAINKSDCIPEPDSSSNIELPQNLRLVSGNDYGATKNILLKLTKDIVLTWDQTVDTTDYTYDVQYACAVTRYTSLYPVKKAQPIQSGYRDFIKGNTYQGKNNISCTMPCSCVNDLVKNADDVALLDAFIINKVNIRVRNVVGRECSNWVTLTIDFSDKSVKATETDKNGDTVPDPQYNNTSVVVDDSTNISKLSNVSEIIEYIKGGFGVFSDNGIVGFFKQAFNGMLPPEFWKAIFAGLAVMLLIGIINFLFKR
ncbi:MAG: hypothetical protein E7271_05070 [Lachnospiraceae bacterium]|jgi:hypothetical protein|nr:hypothetical protein [Lachnospiraceae bacterium]